MASRPSRRKTPKKPWPQENVIDLICRKNGYHKAHSRCALPSADLLMSEVYFYAKDGQRSLKKIEPYKIYACIHDCCQFVTNHAVLTVKYDDCRLDDLKRTSLLVGAKLCAAHKLSRNDHTDRLFHTIYDVFGGFDIIFGFLDPFQSPFNVDHALYPRRDREVNVNLMDRYLETLEYYIKTAGAIRKTVKFSAYEAEAPSTLCPPAFYELSFVDVPLTSACRCSTPLMLACQSHNARAICLLLRHGARPMLPGVTTFFKGFNNQYPLYQITSELNATPHWKDHAADIDPSRLTTFHAQLDNRKDTCLAILHMFAQTMPRLPIRFTRSVSMLTGDNNDECVFNLYREFEQYELPVGMPSLKHLCRVTIRDQISRYDVLPRGIGSLPLPKMIKTYIDLDVELM